ncbi:glycosyltransferase family 2 protein [Shewanella surugensis]|uniref:Glycosyltransferase family 2 protein n=1 Tax=Shewanella surugensis TaxID=212020 RepID=A0ABT0LAK9_9GAMM|nr:glycosyltransferase family 2 protein [Shewanella surugensis]MCL1124599.1 glycosyltransferase family 2 protein [Shewanella surugensis]
MQLAFVIPNYNHTAAISETLANLAGFGLDCYLIDDGSDDETRFLLQQLANQYEWIHLRLHPYNRGKGAAVMTGLRAAYQDGFSHVLQIDADGQHDLTDIPHFIEAATRFPAALISGQPQYDDSIPKGRLYGRYLTHFWVWVETLSFDIKDAMCGFRIYPLQSTEALLSQQALGERMDFDIEVLVKLHWQGVDIKHIPTRVIYPEDGSSHFQGVKDNLRISALHIRLFFGMLKRLPLRIQRPQRQPSPLTEEQAHQDANPVTKKANKHWSSMTERGSYWGIKLLANSYRLGGHWLCRAIMYPVILYFFITGKTARHASMDFLQHVKTVAPDNPQLSHPLNWLDNLKHFFAFGNAALDRIDAWCDRIPPEKIDFPESDILSSHMATGQGAVLLVSHLGNLELCRAISVNHRNAKVNVMVLTHHAENFNQILKQLNPNSALNLIQVTELGPSTSILLQQKIEAGELVVIAGDRTSSNSEGRVIYAPFMGKPAPFPYGPFILAGLLDCPIYSMFCLKEQGKYRVHIKPFNATLRGPRKDRMVRLQQAVNDYSQLLEYHAKQEPLQWFNFYDFWRKDNDAQRLSPTGNEPSKNRTSS